MERWVGEGMEVLGEQPGAGVAYFRLESGRSHAALRRYSRGVELTQVGDLLRLYCKALSGRDVLIMPTEDLTRKGMGWTAEGQPTTEGSAIYLPSLLQSYPTRQQNFDCLKVCATHQAAHLEFGSFDFRFERPARLFENRRLAAEPEIAAHGAPLTDIERFFDLFGERRMAMDAFTVLEDARLDARIASEYPGIRSALRRVQCDAAGERPSPRTMPLRTALLEALLQHSLDPEAAVELPRHLHPPFSAAWAYLARLQDSDATVEDTAEAVLRVYAVLQGLDTSAVQVHEWATVEDGPPGTELPEDGYSLHSSGGQSVGSEFTGNQGDDDGSYVPLPEVPYRGDFKPQLVQTLMKLKDLQGQADPAFAPASAADLKGLLDKLGETEISELLIDDSDVSTGLFATNLLREAGQEGTPGQGMAKSQKRALTGDALRAAAAREYTYDEWDFRANGYRHQWCL
ncbi:MAG: hypothetical protein AAB289_10360, partial [Chloroflexota bacterium]